MLYLAQAMAYLIRTVLTATGTTFVLGAASQDPPDSVLMGSSPPLVLPVRTLTVTHGNVVVFRGHWGLTP